MTISYPKFRAAACHAASVFLDAERTADKACDLIAEAARHGASLVVFPESYIPGFPIWAALQAPIYNHHFFLALVAQAQQLEGAAMQKVRMAARLHGVHVSLGFTEGTDASVGCIWNSNALIGPDGSILNRHRKLVPTFYEKLIWSNGDARGLRVVKTELGRLGMLICGENTNPLARYALMAEGEQVHMSSYPPIWPTRPPGQAGRYDLRRAIEIRAGSQAFEAKVFNIVASGFVDSAMRDAVGQADSKIFEIIDRSPHAVSLVLDPAGELISEVLCDQEGILYAEIDVEKCVEPKQFHDVVGYYNRFDIFRLKVDRSARDPAYFRDVAEAETVDDANFAVADSEFRNRAAE
jgi:aliphatic nitrilase